jgi:hypothetical protein
MGSLWSNPAVWASEGVPLEERELPEGEWSSGSPEEMLEIPFITPVRTARAIRMTARVSSSSRMTRNMRWGY